MNKFKISASKGQKKYSLVLTAASEKQAKERVHSEWYSILSIAAISEADISWNKFIFSWTVNGKKKSWTIIWDDIFKIYVKLRDDLWYHLSELYPEVDKDISAEEKRKILQNLDSSYSHESRWKKVESRDKKKPNMNDKKSLEGFHMKKELDETYAMIDVVIEKLQWLIVNPRLTDEWKKQKLTDVYNSIIKIKKSTNIEKLKQVGEMALLKIWEIELSTLEETKNKESKKLLSETNKLLKQVWSNTQFKEKNKDIKHLFWLFVSDWTQKIENIKNAKNKAFEKKEKNLIDKESYSFLKTLLLLDKYKKRLKHNNSEILKNIIVFIIPFGKERSDIKEKILLKRKVIKQNISLLQAKKSWKIISYTWVVKWYRKWVEKIISLIKIFDSFIFYVVASYCLLFILYINLVHLWYSFSGYSLNYTWVFYFIFLLSAFILTSISRWLFLLSLNFVILFFILIFWVVNF